MPPVAHRPPSRVPYRRPRHIYRTRHAPPSGGAGGVFTIDTGPGFTITAGRAGAPPASAGLIDHFREETLNGALWQDLTEIDPGAYGPIDATGDGLTLTPDAGGTVGLGSWAPFDLYGKVLAWRLSYGPLLFTTPPSASLTAALVHDVGQAGESTVVEIVTGGDADDPTFTVTIGD